VLSDGASRAPSPRLGPSRATRRQGPRIPCPSRLPSFSLDTITGGSDATAAAIARRPAFRLRPSSFVMHAAAHGPTEHASFFRRELQPVGSRQRPLSAEVLKTAVGDASALDNLDDRRRQASAHARRGIADPAGHQAEDQVVVRPTVRRTARRADRVGDDARVLANGHPDATRRQRQQQQPVSIGFDALRPARSRIAPALYATPSHAPPSMRHSCRTRTPGRPAAHRGPRCPVAPPGAKGRGGLPPARAEERDGRGPNEQRRVP
jgi:hypothetical protein